MPHRPQRRVPYVGARRRRERRGGAALGREGARHRRERRGGTTLGRKGARCRQGRRGRHGTREGGGSAQGAAVPSHCRCCCGVAGWLLLRRAHSSHRDATARARLRAHCRTSATDPLPGCPCALHPPRSRLLPTHQLLPSLDPPSILSITADTALLHTGLTPSRSPPTT